MSVANPDRTQAEICVHCRGNTAISYELHISKCLECPDDHPECMHDPIQHSDDLSSKVLIPEDFTDDDLRLIVAMCLSANPWFPEREMFPAWESVYRKAWGELEAR